MRIFANKINRTNTFYSMRYGTILTLAAALMLASCQNKKNEEGGQTDETTSEQTVVKKNIIKKRINILSDFNYLTNLGCIDIIYTPGNYSIEVEGDSTTLTYLSTVFDSNLLTVSLKGDANTGLNVYGNTSNVKMYISCPSLECVSVCSNGGFESQATWRGDNLQVGVLGTGAVNLATVECTTFSLQSSNTGPFKIANLKADDAVFMSTSSSTIEANVDVKNLTIINEGKQTMTFKGQALNTLVKNKKDPNLHLDLNIPVIK